MRANACRLEIEAEVSLGEAKGLPVKSIQGVLDFYDPDKKERRDMLFAIHYNPKQSPPIFEEHIPKGYFGDAAEVNITINDEVYRDLIDRGSGGGRFPYNSNGKVEIKVVKDSKEA